MADIYCSAAGNDTTGNGSVGSPYRQITKAVSVAVNGDTIYCNRGDSFSPFTVSGALTNLTVAAYGSGALPIITGTGNGCSFTTSSGFLTLSDLRFTGCTSSGVSQGPLNTSLTCYRVQMDANGANGFIGSSGGVDTDVSASYFEDCVAFNNTNDGFGIFDSHTMTCVRCTAYGHTAVNSDGFTAHEKSRWLLFYCVAYGNETNVDMINDNSPGSSYAVGCYFHSPSSAAADNNVSIGSPTTAQTNETYLIGCLFYDSRTAPGAANVNVKCQTRSRVNILNCTFWSSTQTTTNWQLYSNQTSGQGWMGWRNCRFACVNDSDARHVYIGTAPDGVTKNSPTIAYCSHNRYDTTGGTTKHYQGGNVTETQWKDTTVRKDKDGGQLDGTGSTWAADPGGGPFTTKESAKIAANSALRNAGTSTTIGSVSATYRYDLFGTKMPQGTAYDIGCHEYPAIMGGGFGAMGFDCSGDDD